MCTFYVFFSFSNLLIVIHSTRLPYDISYILSFGWSPSQASSRSPQRHTVSLSLCLSFLLVIEPRVFYIFSILENIRLYLWNIQWSSKLFEGSSSRRESCSCWQPQSPACSSLSPRSSKPGWLPWTVPTIPAALPPQGLRTSCTVFHLLPDVCWTVTVTSFGPLL